MTFTVLTFSQMAIAFSSRSERDTVIGRSVFSNRALSSAVALTIVLQLLLLYLPVARRVFRTEALSAAELLTAAGVSLVAAAAIEVEKWIRRTLARRRS